MTTRIDRQHIYNLLRDALVLVDEVDVDGQMQPFAYNEDFNDDNVTRGELTTEDGALFHIYVTQIR